MSGGLEPFRNDAPYAHTTVPWERTDLVIRKMLEQNGAVGIQWTTYRGKETLGFIREVKMRGVLKEVRCMVQPPTVERVDRYGKLVRNKNQEYRMLYYWLKSKFEAIKWNMVSFEDEFLSKIRIDTPNGETTIGEILVKMIAEDKLLSLPMPEARH